MPEMVWRGNRLVPVNPEPVQAPEPPAATTTLPVADDDTLVDEFPSVIDEPQGSDDTSEHATDDHHDEHEEHEGMTEDEITKSPTDEPNEMWSVKRLGIGLGVLAVVSTIVIVIAVDDSWRALAGVMSMILMLVLFLFFPAGTVVLFLKKKMTKLLFLTLAVLWVVLFIAWRLIGPLSQTTGPYQ